MQALFETFGPILKDYTSVQLYRTTLKITQRLRGLIGGLYLAIMMSQVLTALSVFSVLLLAGIGIQYLVAGLNPTWPWETFLWLGGSVFAVCTALNVYLYRKATRAPEKLTVQSYERLAHEFDKITAYFLTKAEASMETQASTEDVLRQRIAKLEQSIVLLSEAIEEMEQQRAKYAEPTTVRQAQGL